jgi:hypothetical protein
MRQENKEKKLQDQNLITTPSLGSTPRKMDWLTINNNMTWT